MLKWLTGNALASIAIAIIIGKICDAFSGGVAGATAHVAKTTAVSSVWAAFTTATGMRSFTGMVRRRRKEVRKGKHLRIAASLIDVIEGVPKAKKGK